MKASRYREDCLNLEFQRKENNGSKNVNNFIAYFDSIKGKVYNNEITRLDFPLEIMIETTNTCNLDCKYCYKNNLKCSNIDFISLDMIRQIAISIGLHGDTVIYLEGGEPFLHPNIIEIMSILKSYNIPVDILSNGTVIPDEFLKKFRDGFLNRMDDIQISLDGIGDFNNNNRGITSEKILNNIRKLNLYGIKPRVNCIVTKFNYKGITSLLKTLNSECEISILSFNTPIGVSYQDLVVDDATALKLLKEINSVAEELKFPIQGSVIKLEQSCAEKGTGDTVHFRCTAMRSKMCVSTNGDIYPCVFLENRMQPIGNLNEKSIVEIWKSEKSNKYVDGVIERNRKCMSCSNSEFCPQYCAGMMI